MAGAVQHLVRILKSLADLNRLRIISALGAQSLSVTEIINATGLPQTLVSFHLKTLRNTDIVQTERNGPFIFYRLSSPGLIDTLNHLAGDEGAMAPPVASSQTENATQA